ncbi:MAG: YraN family protein [Bacillota bacterium]|nr:YraN family protein [Bacillota bacterium]MDD3297475.1 YraN family protein [Bacillota bacterium]MDD4706871.1 YraN family protein [Bacillota bacterium]
MTSGRSIGKMGEEAARRYLEDMGYRIIETNYRDKQGEADIIGFDDKVLAFVEVKTRRNTRYGTPGEAVNHTKQRRLTRIAVSYLARHRMLYRQIRFDVVEVVVQDGAVKQIRLIKDAFDAVQ